LALLGEETGRLDDDLHAELAFHGSSAGVLALTTLISLPLTTRMSGSLSGADFFDSTVPLNLPWVESYLSR
jgi:hypothetical protein